MQLSHLSTMYTLCIHNMFPNYFFNFTKVIFGKKLKANTKNYYLKLLSMVYISVPFYCISCIILYNPEILQQCDIVMTLVAVRNKLCHAVTTFSALCFILHFNLNQINLLFSISSLSVATLASLAHHPQPSIFFLFITFVYIQLIIKL